MWGTQNWLRLWQKAHQGWTLHQSKMPICFATWYEWCFPPFACIERKWTGGEWWLCLHVKVTLGNSLARQKLAWLFSKRSHWPQDIWVKMDSISVSLLQTLYANSTLCKCVVFVYSKRGGFKCLCPSLNCIVSVSPTVFMCDCSEGSLSKLEHFNTLGCAWEFMTTTQRSYQLEVHS